MVSTKQAAVQARPRILTIGIGSFGRMVGRQIRRTVKNAPCIFPDICGDIQLDSPEIKSRICRSDVIFMVLDVRDEQARDVVKKLVEKTIVKDAMKVLTFDHFEGDSEEEYVILFQEDSPPCTCLLVSPLSLNPLPEDFLPKFGVQMIAGWLICCFIEMFINWNGTENDLDSYLSNLKVAFENGGILRMCEGMSFRKVTR